MTDAIIVSTARTGLAKSWRGSLNMTHGATLGGHVVRHAMERAHVDPAQVEGSSFLDGDGRLTSRGRELLHYCHDHDLTLGTGHVSWQESMAFIQEAHAIGFRRTFQQQLRRPANRRQRRLELMRERLRVTLDVRLALERHAHFLEGAAQGGDFLRP